MCFVFYLFALHLKVELRFVLPYMFSTLADLYVYMADVGRLYCTEWAMGTNL